MKESFEYFCDNITWEDTVDYMEGHGIECEAEALQKMYEEYEISFYYTRGDM